MFFCWSSSHSSALAVFGSIQEKPNWIKPTIYVNSV
jgi:hypothetical protein